MRVFQMHLVHEVISQSMMAEDYMEEGRRGTVI